MKPADGITAKDILEEFHRSTRPKERSWLAKWRLKDYGPGKNLMKLRALGGATALEILARLFEWYDETVDEDATLGDVLDGKV